jgi:hypothetical protein
MEERDFLKEMFECYFRFRKMNSEITIERLSDAIIGALSGLDYPKYVREDLLNDLTGDCDIIKETTQKVKIAREQILNTITAPVTIIEEAKSSSSDWMDIDGVCREFKLSRNNIKSREWRENNNFPSYQTSIGSKVTFNRKEVEEWIKSR